MSSLLGKVKATESNPLSAGFDFNDDPKPVRVLATLDLLNPVPCEPVLVSCRKSHVIDATVEMGAYHAMSGYYSSSSIASTARLTEREVAHNNKPHVKAKKQEAISASPFVKNGAKIHDVIEAIVKNGLRNVAGDGFQSYIAKYQPLPAFKLNSKDGVNEAIAELEQYFDQAALTNLKGLAADAGSTAFQQSKALVQLMIEANPYFIPAATHEYILSLLEELERLPYVANLLKYAVAEASVFNQVDRTKIRPDVVVPEPVFGRPLHVSVKTTHDADRWERQFYANGLHIQEGMYNHELSMALCQPVTSLFLLIECKPSGLVQIKLKEVGEDTILQWQDQFFEAFERFKAIEASDSPKGYEGKSTLKWGVELL